MRGLLALLNEGVEIVNFWDTPHAKVPDFRSDTDEADWAEYSRLRAAGSGCTVLNLHRGANGIFWNQEIRQVYEIMHKVAEGESIDIGALDDIYNSFRHDIKLENFN